MGNIAAIASLSTFGVLLGGAVVPAQAADDVFYACLRKGELSQVGTDVPTCRKGKVVRWNVRGEPGVQGPTGATGAVGPAGPAGVDGAPGTQGATGAVGPVGPRGPEGAVGAQGPEGPIGPEGPEGPRGPAGAVGAQGPQGPVGPAGPVGPTGPPGPPGTSPIDLACDTLANKQATNHSDVDIFLKIATIPGESVDDKHAREIDLRSFCMGGLSDADAGVFTVEKRVDVATPKLIEALATQGAIDKAVVSIESIRSDLRATYTFTGLKVDGYRFGGHGDSDEDVSFTWSKVGVTTGSAALQELTAPPVKARTQPRCDQLTTTEPAAAATSYQGFLKIASIPGSSVDDKHANEIDVRSLCFGASTQTTPRYLSFTMTKPADRATGPLLNAFTTGADVGTTSIVLRRVGGVSNDLLRITMERPVIDAMRTGGRGGNLHDDVSVGFASATITYLQQTASGTTPVSVTIER